MKLLFVTPDLPYPPRKGYMLMAYHHIKHLAARHSVDLISFVDKANDVSDTGGLSDWCGHIERIDLPTRHSLLKMAFGLLREGPLQVTLYRSHRMAEAVNNRLCQTKYNAVIFQLTRMAQYCPDWYQGPTILNMVDPFVLNYQRSLAWRPSYMRPLVQIEIARLKRYERRHARRFDRVLLIAQADVRDYQNLVDGAKLACVPHGIDVETFCPSASVPRQAGMIVISGNMRHAPNVDAVEYFCREVFPLIRKREPSAHLWLVGSRPALAVRKWANDEHTKITGFVRDIRPYLNQAMVSVCPIRLKVGAQTKVLEALAMSTPVVTTSAGNHGIGAVSGEHLYVADTPSEFAERVVALLRGEKWAELSQAGRRFVVENFTWEKSVSRLEKILGEVIEQGIGRLSRSTDP